MVIYYVEDDKSVRDLSVYALKSAGFDARGYSDSLGFFEALRDCVPDMILLDIMLPGDDGLAILSRLRSDPSTSTVPIMLLTAKGSEYDKVYGLDAGADDYLVKPFGMMELVSRVKALFRRSNMASSQVESDDLVELGDLVINRTKHLVTVCGSPLKCTLKEFDLLSLFAAHPSRVFSREQLMERVWGTSFVGETRTVDVHVQKLRQKLDDASDGFGSHICTVRGVGYCYRD